MILLWAFLYKQQKVCLITFFRHVRRSVVTRGEQHMMPRYKQSCLTAALLLLAWVTSCNSFVTRGTNTLYYASTLMLDRTDALDHCQSLGGSLAGDYEFGNEAFVNMIARGVNHSFWLSAHRCDHRHFCWGIDGDERVYDALWCPNEPSCDYDECGFYYGTQSTRNGDDAYCLTTTDYTWHLRRALCAFDGRSAIQMESLRKHAERMCEDDRTAILGMLDVMFVTSTPGYGTSTGSPSMVTRPSLEQDSSGELSQRMDKLEQHVDDLFEMMQLLRSELRRILQRI